jgi:hypothetical protein
MFSFLGDLMGVPRAPEQVDLLGVLGTAPMLSKKKTPTHCVPEVLRGRHVLLLFASHGDRESDSFLGELVENLRQVRNMSAHAWESMGERRHAHTHTPIPFSLWKWRL